jgi:Rps23 Pro-64 3,4-dihydroxylase Tpa1-like proline 4-hydroxylase
VKLRTGLIMDRRGFANAVATRLAEEKARLSQHYAETEPGIGYFYIDDPLPAEAALRIYRQFPKAETMTLKRSLREHKYVAAQMNEYDPILEEAVYGFQDPRVVELIRQICGIGSAFPDQHLYAGGISMMGEDQFLNPHLDNSHDKGRHRWRVLNLLYYVTPDWKKKNGGNLELWPDGVGGRSITIHSRFNRLVVVATHGGSWHSVSPIRAPGYRCCVSNYYFSAEPLRESDRFHVTSFRGRPGQRARDLVLRGDIALRTALRRVFRTGIRENPHVYKRP